jgi:hypothetical protein
MTGQVRPSARWRGGPLVMLALLLTGWSAGRAVLWENPFAALASSLDMPALAVPLALPALPNAPDALTARGPAGTATLPLLPPRADGGAAQAPPLMLAGSFWRGSARPGAGNDPRLATAHYMLWVAALRDPLLRAPMRAGFGTVSLADEQAVSPPFLPSSTIPATAAASGKRWSVDAWAFWRQGSDAAPISLGRVPIYGASQAGAVLQYRLAPGSRRDPRAYARAYRALVRRGESELAVGASARPLGRVPLRAAAEVRYTDGAFTNTWRPAAYAVTEFAPQPLPLGTRLEAYGQAGWVGGPNPTAFADGQASVTGEVRRFANRSDNVVRFSFGAAAWGGAQEDAQRIDVGPTLRFDLRVGTVPARLSVDWRERVGGDAGPDSGVAATLSTSF